MPLFKADATHLGTLITCGQFQILPCSWLDLAKGCTFVARWFFVWVVLQVNAIHPLSGLLIKTLVDNLMLKKQDSNIGFVLGV